MKHLLLKLCFKNKCPHLLYITNLQQINDYNTYHKNHGILHWSVWRGRLYCCFIYGPIVVIVVLFFLGHILGSGIVAYFQFILDLRVPLLWFFIIVSFFIINHIYIIIDKCYPGWLPSQTC